VWTHQADIDNYNFFGVSLAFGLELKLVEFAKTINSTKTQFRTIFAQIKATLIQAQFMPNVDSFS